MAPPSKYLQVKDKFVEMIRAKETIESMEKEFDVKYKTLQEWWMKAYREGQEDFFPPIPEDNRSKKTNKVKVSKNFNISLSFAFLEGLKVPLKEKDVYDASYDVVDGYDVITLKHKQP